ncbi:MAG: F0F1 ATP synthase subunit gamma [Acetobacteraceae bacterium]|nr:F0F1 ATP synthase subunit gamma [Acetobacteraceae bacterium]
MTERLADISARMDGIGQLGAVVNAMRGIAAARAQQAIGQLPAADSHAATIAAAISRVLAMLPSPPPSAHAANGTALVVFCAEQGFVGAFSEHVLDAIGPDLATASLLAIGTRGLAMLAERGVEPLWSAAMPGHTQGIPRLADHIADAVYARVAAGEIGALDAVFSRRGKDHLVHVQRRRLFPLDPGEFHSSAQSNPPLLTQTPEVLLRELTAEYLHAQLCAIALHAFAAENEARMEAMAMAHGQIDRQLAALRATQRRVRQDEITAEIIELAAGAARG